MLKPYTRQQMQTDKVLSDTYNKWLETILKNSNTIYEIYDMPLIADCKFLIRNITGLDNLVILRYRNTLSSDEIYLVDSEHGYTISHNLLYSGLVGLRTYGLFKGDSGYIIKTNYKNARELADMLGIEDAEYPVINMGRGYLIYDI